MAAAEPPPDRPSLSDTFSGVPLTSHTKTWDSLYRDDHYPWDRAGPSLALADLLTQRPDLVPHAQELDQRGNPLRDQTGAVVRRTALVPGCGRGHDVLLLSSFGYDVCGLDASADGLRLARQNRVAAEAEHRYEPAADIVEAGDIQWIEGDFFSDTWAAGIGSQGSGTFDLIFDYTFLCALPPEARPRWAARMVQLLSPQGRLICLEFPSGKPLTESGPPWGLTPEVYELLLSAPGKPLTYDNSGCVVDVTSTKPHEDALHRLSLIKPQRTHKAGTNDDGTISDFISVWSR